MLDNLKSAINFRYADKLISKGEYEKALDKLNYLVNEGYNLKETLMKRGRLCKKLLMTKSALSDFNYIINHYPFPEEAYFERMSLNYESADYVSAIADANYLIPRYEDKFEIKKIKFMSLLLSGMENEAKDFIYSVFFYDKYKTLQFLFNESSEALASDNYSSALKILDAVELLDGDNPIKLLKEANIYKLAGFPEKEAEISKKLENVFPRYFISHFKFKNIYEPYDLLEISFLQELSVFDRRNLFTYPLKLLEGYKEYALGHITDSKACFEKAVEIEPERPDAYVLLAQILQIMSGYDNGDFTVKAQYNYKKAMEIYHRAGASNRENEMKLQLRHLNSNLLSK